MHTSHVVVLITVFEMEDYFIPPQTPALLLVSKIRHFSPKAQRGSICPSLVVGTTLTFYMDVG
jgi:hypothetical protein